eukprot:Skav220505  [mRNA]  locus=scaffold4697:94428:100653:- [translate_table: standard]
MKPAPLNHQRGRCDPCVFVTSIGCPKGDACHYCHFPHGEVKTTHRPRKQTRDKYKADLQELLQRHQGNLEEIHSQLQAEARKNPYVRKLLQGYLDGSEPTGAIDSLRINGFSGPFVAKSAGTASCVSGADARPFPRLVEMADGERPLERAVARCFIDGQLID